MYGIVSSIACTGLCIVIGTISYLSVRGDGIWRSSVWQPVQGRRTGGAVASLLCIFSLILAGCARDQTAQTTTPMASQQTPIPTIVATATSTQPQAQTQWADWTTYHHDMARDGYIAQTPDATSLKNAWRVPLDGAVYAQPLMVKGRLIAATEGDSLYALNPQTGQMLWHINVGTPVPQSTLQCGDIDPLGITGTPVYDPATNLIFAVAEITGPQHILVGIDANTGQVRVRRSVDLPGMDVGVYQQRAALALEHHMVYVAYGGLYGDCGQYIGTVVGSQTNGQGNLLSYQVPTAREAGIWAPSGPAIDSAGNIYVSAGNGAATSGAWDHSDAVIRLSPQLQYMDAFAPASWAQENSSDTDLSSTGPLLLPNGYLFISGKSGAGYILHANNLGGVGGQVSKVSICNGAYGGSALVGSTILVPCNNGVTSVSVDSQGHMSVGWHANQLLQSPTVGGHTVYSLSGQGTLYAADLSSGAIRTQVNIGDAVPHFATPMISNHSLFMGTEHGVAAVTIG